MIFLGPIISWVAFCYLVWRAMVQTWEWADGFRRGPASPGKFSLVDFYSNLSDQGQVMFWSPLWGIVAMALVAPWLRQFLLRIKVIHPAGAYTEDRAELANTLGRWTISLSLLGGIAGLVPGDVLRFAVEGHGWEVTGSGLLKAVILITLVPLCIAPEISVLLSSKFTGFIDSVFFPGARDKKPPYTIKLARFYVEKNRLDEAEAEFARMLKFYPQEAEAWQERLALAFLREKKLRSGAAGGEETEVHPAPQAVLAAGLKALRVAADQERLHAVFLRKGA